MRRYKRLTTALLAAAVAAGIVTGCGASGQDIGQDEAKRIAFEDAGVSESDTSRLKVEKDRDDGVLQYDVQFSVDEKEYSYDINGANGEILSADVETKGTAGQSAAASGQDDTAAGAGAGNTDNTGNTGNTGSTAGAADVAVSEADARAAALERVPEPLRRISAWSWTLTTDTIFTREISSTTRKSTNLRLTPRQAAS